MCDLRVATSRSRFAIPAARLGLAVDRWTVDRLVQEFTPPIARAMLVAAETYDADRLFAAGVVHRLGTLDDALTWAAETATLAPLTLAAHKLGVEGSDDFDAAREHAWHSADAAEGRAAFLEKRPARFEGR